MRLAVAGVRRAESLASIRDATLARYRIRARLSAKNFHELGLLNLPLGDHAVNFRRREWLIMCGVALAAAALGRGIETFGGAAGMRGLKPGAKEYLRATAEAREAQRRRRHDRGEMLRRSEIRAGWVRYAHDRFSASPAVCDLDVQTTGRARVRGIAPQRIEDKASGDLLILTNGDYGDRTMAGSLRVGRDGEPLSLVFRATEEDGQSVLVVMGWLVSHTNLGKDPGRPFPDAKAMNVLARLFNCGGFQFVAMGEGPHILDRPKERYGPNKIGLYVRDRNAFLDRYVDQHYASLGLDPSLGRLDPDSIPRP
jgi:hypothetical protein